MWFSIGQRSFLLFAEERQWDKFHHYLHIYLLDNRPAQAGILLLLLSIVLWALFTRWKKRNVGRRLVLLCYLCALLLLFVLSHPVGERGIRSFSLRWYLTKQGFHESRVLISLINLICFLPVGDMLRGEEKIRGIMRKTASVLLFSIVIECSQFLLHRGFFAIQDILAYLTGAWLGMLLSACREHFRKRREKKHVHSNRFRDDSF